METALFIAQLVGMFLNLCLTILFSVWWEKAFINERPELGLKRNRILYPSLLISPVLAAALLLKVGYIPEALFLPPIIAIMTVQVVMFITVMRSKRNNDDGNTEDEGRPGPK